MKGVDTEEIEVFCNVNMGQYKAKLFLRFDCYKVGVWHLGLHADQVIPRSNSQVL